MNSFYSSFLIADRVTVASKSTESPSQYVFESEADAQGFSIAEDPRGNTLGRGTEITLWLKEDAKEYLDNAKLRTLIERDAEYGASPIYLWTETTTTEVVEDETPAPEADVDGEVKVEDDAEAKEPVTREVKSAEWSLVNDRAPLWMRDPKDVSAEEHEVLEPPRVAGRGLCTDPPDPRRPFSRRPSSLRRRLSHTPTSSATWDRLASAL